VPDWYPRLKAAQYINDNPAPPWLRNEPAVWWYWQQRAHIARVAELEAQAEANKGK
jgi:hypothetical protein